MRETIDDANNDDVDDYEMVTTAWGKAFLFTWVADKVSEGLAKGHPFLARRRRGESATGPARGIVYRRASHLHRSATSGGCATQFRVVGIITVPYHKHAHAAVRHPCSQCGDRSPLP